MPFDLASAKPVGDYKVPPEEQQERDRKRLSLLEDEQARYTDPQSQAALATEVKDTKAKLPAAQFDLSSARPVAAPSSGGPPSTSADAKPSPTTLPPLPTGRFGGTPLAEAALNMGTGMVAKPLSDIAGLGAVAGSMLGFGGTPDARVGATPQGFAQDLQRKLTYEPRTDAGKAMAEWNPMALIGKGVGKLADYAGSAVERALPPGPWGAGAGYAAKGAVEEAPTVAGALTGARAAKTLPALEERLAIAKGENKAIDDIRKAAHDADYITPPERGVKAAVAGITGKTKPEKAISPVNELNATRRLGAEVGVPEGRSLTEPEFDRLKKDTGRFYDEVPKALGPKITGTSEFEQSLRQTLARIDGLTDQSGFGGSKRVINSFLKKFEQGQPGIVNTIERAAAEQPGPRLARTLESASADLPKAVGTPTLSTATVMRDIQQLRKDAKDDFRKGDSNLGETRTGIATQLENLVEHNLAKTGQQALIEAYRAARERFAKIYLLERVTEPNGRVNLHKLGSLAESPRYKGVLTGEFKTAADFANTFGKAAQKSTGEAVPRLTVLDGLFAIGAFAHGAPGAAMAEIGARVGVPMMAEHGWLQSKTPSYVPSGFRRTLPLTAPAAGALTTPSEQ